MEVIDKVHEIECENCGITLKYKDSEHEYDISDTCNEVPYIREGTESSITIVFYLRKYITCPICKTHNQINILKKIEVETNYKTISLFYYETKNIFYYNKFTEAKEELQTLINTIKEAYNGN